MPYSGNSWQQLAVGAQLCDLLRALLSVLLACRCSWSFECPHASTKPAELSHPPRAHATSTSTCVETYAIQHAPDASCYAGGKQNILTNLNPPIPLFFLL